MVFASGLGIVLSVVFGILLLALIGELYYLLWWKKLQIRRRSIQPTSSGQHSRKELLFCWKQQQQQPPSPPTRSAASHSTNHQRSVTTATTAGVVDHPSSDDVETGASKEFLLRAFEGVGEQELGGIESELMRLHNLTGPPRFLFTIKEETREDLDSDDGGARSHRKKRSKTNKSLGDLIDNNNNHNNNNNNNNSSSTGTNPFSSSLPSPPLKVKVVGNEDDEEDVRLECYSRHGINPLFESVWVDAELDRLRSSPPPKFKFLREAEEKLYKRLLEEAEKMNHNTTTTKINGAGAVGGDDDGKKMSAAGSDDVVVDGGSSFIKIIVAGGKNGSSNHNYHHHHSGASQVLPLSSSPGRLSAAAGAGERKPGSD